MLVYPAIDLREGKCVRLLQGDFSKETVYSDAPMNVAKSFADQGAEWVHIVDLDGARTGEPVHLKTIESIVRHTGLKVQTGGGIRDLETARNALQAGASRVVFGTRLALEPGSAMEIFAELGDQAVAGIDSRDGKAKTSGWEQTAEVDAFDLAVDLKRQGARWFVITDIATDGMLTGPNLPMLERYGSALGSGLIASGGVGSLDDLESLRQIPGIEGAIVGKAIYEGRFDLAEAIEKMR